MKKSFTAQEYERIIATTQIIGDQPTILILIELIEFGEKSFNELKRMTTINQVTLSRKLSHLRELGLVSVERVGNETHYAATKKALSYGNLTKEIQRLALAK
jgi:DNA-binding HxlR family transcriptional regulator